MPPAQTAAPAPAETAPAMTAAPAETAAPQAEAPKPKTIVDVATEANFTKLVELVKAAGLAETLAGTGPYTVFAPSDEAFAKVAKKDYESWLKPENKEKLTKVLTYHVLPQKVMAVEVLKMDKQKAKTVNGKEIKIAVKDKDVTLDGKAKVTKTDVEASNGVIHVIDTVLMP